MGNGVFRGSAIRTCLAGGVLAAAAVLLAACNSNHTFGGTVIYTATDTFHVDPVSGHLVRTTLWEDQLGRNQTVVQTDLTVNGNERRRPGTRSEHIDIRLFP